MDEPPLMNNDVMHEIAIAGGVLKPESATRSGIWDLGHSQLILLIMCSFF
jgi:hypothetical protein